MITDYTKKNVNMIYVYIYMCVSGHEGVSDLLPGFAIKW